MIDRINQIDKKILDLKNQIIQLEIEQSNLVKSLPMKVQVMQNTAIKIIPNSFVYEHKGIILELINEGKIKHSYCYELENQWFCEAEYNEIKKEGSFVGHKSGLEINFDSEIFYEIYEKI